METPPEANKVSKLEALSDEIRTRRGELGSARKINGASAAVPQTAESKLQVYRNRSQLLRAYNRSVRDEESVSFLRCHPWYAHSRLAVHYHPQPPIRQRCAAQGSRPSCGDYWCLAESPNAVHQ